MLATIILAIITTLSLIISFVKNKEKTKKSLKASGKMLKNMGSQVLAIILLISLFLSLIPKELITKLLGNSNNIINTLNGAILGTITIIPGIIAFPLAKELLSMGAFFTAIAAFITTLTMVGFATAPIEISFFGKRFTFFRNIISFFIAILIALLLGLLYNNI